MTKFGKVLEIVIWVVGLERSGLGVYWDELG